MLGSVTRQKIFVFYRFLLFWFWFVSSVFDVVARLILFPHPQKQRTQTADSLPQNNTPPIQKTRARTHLQRVGAERRRGLLLRRVHRLQRRHQLAHHVRQRHKHRGDGHAGERKHDAKAGGAQRLGEPAGAVVVFFWILDFVLGLGGCQGL
jgi:hypothetical protein